jgi:hypothetical protein
MGNVVYIFGAGASKDFGLPLGVEIFDSAYRLSNLTDTNTITGELKSVLVDVDQYMRQIFANLPEDTLNYPPFEEVLTFLWDCKKTERFDYDKNRLTSLFKEKYGAEAVFDIFVKMLGLTLAGSMQLQLPGNRIQAFKDFIKSLDFKKRNISFISLNYDVILDNILFECVSEGIIEDYTYGAPLSDIAEKNMNASDQKFCRENGVLLLKPHGSLNLVLCRRHRQCSCGEGFYYSNSDFLAVKAKDLKCPGCYARLEPLLIPPLYNKSDYVAKKSVIRPGTWRSTSEVYRWSVDRRIMEILQNADEIVVIGYSLPAYDYDFKTLLMTSLMQNKKRKKVLLRLITKGKESAKNLKLQFERFVGLVVIESSDGFYNYLTTLGRGKSPATARRPAS